MTTYVGREDLWHRPKRYLGKGHSRADDNGYEKWPRYGVEVPPELAVQLEAAQRKSLGVNATPTNATRANLVRAALRMYLQATDPEREAAIEGTAIEIFNDIEQR